MRVSQPAPSTKKFWKRKMFKKRWQYYGGGRDTAEDFMWYVEALAHGKDPFEEERNRMPGFYKKGGKHEVLYAQHCSLLFG